MLAEVNAVVKAVKADTDRATAPVIKVLVLRTEPEMDLATAHNQVQEHKEQMAADIEAASNI